MALWTRVATPDFFQRVLKRQRIDNGREHAHVIARGALDPSLTAGQAAENISAANHNHNLHSEVADFTNLPRHILNGFRRNSNSALAANGFSAELKQDAAVFSFGCFFHESMLQKEPGNGCDNGSHADQYAKNFQKKSSNPIGDIQRHNAKQDHDCHRGIRQIARANLVKNVRAAKIGGNAAAANCIKVALIASIFSQKYCWHSVGERQQFAERETDPLSEFYRQTDRELVVIFPGAAERLDFVITRLRKGDGELFVARLALAAGAFPGRDFELGI